MTPEQIEQHRKRFEKLTGFGPLALGRIRTSGMYATKGVEPMWRGYLMFAENLEVELPQVLWADNIGDSVYVSDQVHIAIESQGYKIKII